MAISCLPAAAEVAARPGNTLSSLSILGCSGATCWLPPQRANVSPTSEEKEWNEASCIMLVDGAAAKPTIYSIHSKASTQQLLDIWEIDPLPNRRFTSSSLDHADFSTIGAVAVKGCREIWGESQDCSSLSMKTAALDESRASWGGQSSSPKSRFPPQPTPSFPPVVSLTSSHLQDVPW
ncbi:hypothetical protein EV426DRAFT_709046 [Tirmania nivea]|nr:hypothetical protein EV426DRAFT_709046 [Tirmania nivea]